jgi:gluconate 2-dehydrogenase gamma chain
MAHHRTSRQALSEHHARTLAAVADRFFPAEGDSPSGSELGVVDYVDGQLAGPWGQGDRLYRDGPHRVPVDAGHGWQSPLTPSEVFIAGLSVLDDLARRRGGTGFADLGPVEADGLLSACERGEIEEEVAAGISVAAFFAMLRTSIVEGLFADPRYGGNRDHGGWRWVGFPPERARYAQ